MQYEIGDIVEVDCALLQVTGVIHDSEQLFITPFEGGREQSIKFNKIVNVWRKIERAIPGTAVAQHTTAPQAGRPASTIAQDVVHNNILPQGNNAGQALGKANMKVIEIERTVSGQNYSNMKMKAVLSENEDPIQASVELDNRILQAVAAIQEKDKVAQSREQKKEDALRKLVILEKLIKDNESFDLPF